MTEDCCEDCLKLEGKAVPVKSKFKLNGKVVKDPPLHRNCKCVLMYSENQDLEPQLQRDIQTIKEFSEMINSSTYVKGVENYYFALLYLLDELSGVPQSELKAAGVSVRNGFNLVDYTKNLRNNKDIIFEQAIQRAYDFELKEAAHLKTLRGRRNRLLRLRDDIMECRSLSPHNLSFLYMLIPN